MFVGCRMMQPAVLGRILCALDDLILCLFLRLPSRPIVAVAQASKGRGLIGRAAVEQDQCSLTEVTIGRRRVRAPCCPSRRHVTLRASDCRAQAALGRQSTNHEAVGCKPTQSDWWARRPDRSTAAQTDRSARRAAGRTQRVGCGRVSPLDRRPEAALFGSVDPCRSTSARRAYVHSTSE
ncbi:unnamed protein product [Protopolystoma xenopodis]|uniref:Uncharacterized protein n=1 Tax=Protopolystoma xenopodis TaxID=117903 RepID=A0A3S5ANB3_9PLAT|nr:unnamed protein product [Protopolystoma xenopodis]